MDPWVFWSCIQISVRENPEIGGSDMEWLSMKRLKRKGLSVKKGLGILTKCHKSLKD